MEALVITRRRAYVCPKDPARKPKEKALAFFECDGLSGQGEAAARFDFADLSCLDTKQHQELADCASRCGMVLVSPEVSMSLDAKRIPGNYVEAHPLRGWAAATRVRQYREAGSGGQLSSMRIFWEWPRKLARTAKAFQEDLIPELLDLTTHVAGLAVESIYVERIPKENAAFLLVTLAGNVAAEININEALPNSLEPVRFIHAYFTKGACGNMPLYGYENGEGILVASDGEARREVCEHVSWDGRDEWEDHYLRMVGAIFDGEYGEPRPLLREAYRSAVRKALSTREPAAVTGGVS